ncbi:MAG: hypothetical protein QM831_35765 [Kofleriaceae bacterium]
MIDGQMLPDAPDAKPGTKCFGSIALDNVCWDDTMVPSGDKAFNGTLGALDTASSSSCNRMAMTNPDMPCVVAAGSIEINTNLRVIGMNGIVFVATTGDITIASGATIDASGVDVNPTQGAGARTTCSGTTAPEGKAGGFGGSFVDPGGNGGKSADNNNHNGGVAATVLMTDSIHGGCPGGKGGEQGGCNAPGVAGRSGGAIVLIAKVGKIQLDGAVLAYGEHGTGATDQECGGGGGAAGGLVVLDSMTITGSGEVNVKGGAGGGGTGGTIPGGDGHDGLDGSDRALDGSAGSDNTSGGDGGHGGPHDPMMRNKAGSDASGESGVDAVGDGGGGGGGGASGVVITTSTPNGITGL